MSFGLFQGKGGGTCDLSRNAHVNEVALLDFENPLDDDRDNVYAVTVVECGDASNS